MDIHSHPSVGLTDEQLDTIEHLPLDSRVEVRPLGLSAQESQGRITVFVKGQPETLVLDRYGLHIGRLTYKDGRALGLSRSFVDTINVNCEERWNAWLARIFPT